MLRETDRQTERDEKGEHVKAKKGVREKIGEKGEHVKGKEMGRERETEGKRREERRREEKRREEKRITKIRSKL